MEVERVEAIASLSNPVNTIPLEYIRSENEQPEKTTMKGSVLNVPAIDISASVDEAWLVDEIARASEEWGLFQIVNHGIPSEVIALLQKAGKEFFESPQEEKEKIAKKEGSKSVEGYGTKLQKEAEGKKGWVDHLFHLVWPPTVINHKFWPQNPSYYREANEEYCKHLRAVAEKLFKYLSKGLGLEENEMLESFGGKDLEYMMKINYYPPCPRPDVVLGVTAHTDLSSLTILVPNDVPGLQVFRDGHWYDVEYIPNALIVHIGDQIEIVSNGKYKAVLHRTTVNKDKVRMSWPVFLEPPPEKEVGPHPKLVEDDKENPPKYKTKKFRDYQYCKLNKLPQ